MNRPLNFWAFLQQNFLLNTATLATQGSQLMSYPWFIYESQHDTCREWSCMASYPWVMHCHRWSWMIFHEIEEILDFWRKSKAKFVTLKIAYQLQWWEIFHVPKIPNSISKFPSNVMCCHSTWETSSLKIDTKHLKVSLLANMLLLFPSNTTSELFWPYSVNIRYQSFYCNKNVVQPWLYSKWGLIGYKMLDSFPTLRQLLNKKYMFFFQNPKDCTNSSLGRGHQLAENQKSFHYNVLHIRYSILWSRGKREKSDSAYLS